MTDWLFLGGMVLLALMAKFIKEMSDVRSLERMPQKEKVAVLARRNYYDNHA